MTESNSTPEILFCSIACDETSMAEYFAPDLDRLNNILCKLMQDGVVSDIFF